MEVWLSKSDREKETEGKSLSQLSKFAHQSNVIEMPCLHLDKMSLLWTPWVIITVGLVVMDFCFMQYEGMTYLKEIPDLNWLNGDFSFSVVTFGIH